MTGTVWRPIYIF